MSDCGGNQRVGQFANLFLIEMRPDENQACRHFGSILQRQKQQLSLVAHLLERVKSWRVRQADKPFRPEDRIG